MSRFFNWFEAEDASLIDAVVKPVVAIVVIGLIAATQLAAFVGAILLLKHLFSG